MYIQIQVMSYPAIPMTTCELGAITVCNGKPIYNNQSLVLHELLQVLDDEKLDLMFLTNEKVLTPSSEF